MPFSRSRSFESIMRSSRDSAACAAKEAGLLEHGVDDGRLAVVDVGDDGYVTDVVARGHDVAYSRSGEDGLRVRLCHAGPAGLNMPRPYPIVRGSHGAGLRGTV